MPLLEDEYTSDWSQLSSLMSDTSLERHSLLLLMYALQTTIYSLWRERNNRRYEESPPTAIYAPRETQTRPSVTESLFSETRAIDNMKIFLCHGFHLDL